jgi:hypothetical protein
VKVIIINVTANKNGNGKRESLRDLYVKNHKMNVRNLQAITDRDEHSRSTSNGCDSYSCSPRKFLRKNFSFFGDTLLTHPPPSTPTNFLTEMHKENTWTTCTVATSRSQGDVLPHEGKLISGNSMKEAGKGNRVTLLVCHSRSTEES